MKINKGFIVAGLILSGCTPSVAPDLYNTPAGYTYADNTPISTPHGYDKTPDDEQKIRIDDAVNAESWRNAIAAAMMPVVNALEMNKPVAIHTDADNKWWDGGKSNALNAAAVNYARDMMVKMGYLTALPNEADQVLLISAHPSADKPGQTDVTATALRAGVMVESHTATTVIDAQKETGWARYIPHLGEAKGPSLTMTPRTAATYDGMND